ncbi:MAG: hypothetical protein GX575_19215 [Candidatus Anammoximicrobium sp.]|nr:hypothetical protein [Candidatus Anammoximicrobium sp.]
MVSASVPIRLKREAASGRGPLGRSGCLLRLCAAVSLSLACGFPGAVRAQATWEYSAYSIKVWIALDPAAELTTGLAERITAAIAQRSWVVAGATWQVQVVPCPAALAWAAACHPDLVTAEAVQAADLDVLKQDDKLFLLSVRDDLTGLTITARELDCRTRRWQPAVTRHVTQPARVPDEAFAALLEAFVPFGRIESSKGKQAIVRVRAAGLIVGDSSPARLAEHAVLLPIIRRNDRLGEPLANGIYPATWTFLTVTGRKGLQLECQVHSGMTSPLGGRSSTRTVRLALRAKPRLEATELEIQTHGDAPLPLGGYEIYSKPPDSEDAELLGVTDWRGRIRVERKPNPLQILYVRNGGRLLARLPVVSGLEPLVTAQVPDDDPRLFAEGYVKGLQNRVMDLVARRELYTARFRRLLQKKEFDQAKTLLEEFRALETRSDLTRQLDQQEQRARSPDRRVQAKIDQLFTDTRQLLLKFLDPRTSNQLADELLRAQRAG